MFANNPLAMVRYRQMQTESLVRDAAAYRIALDALRGRRRVEAQPRPAAETTRSDESAPSATQ